MYRQTWTALKSLEKILNECGSSMKYVTNLKIYLTNNTKLRYSEVREGYVEFFHSRNLPVPSIITVGCSSLALGADVEIDGSAVLPPKSKL